MQMIFTKETIECMQREFLADKLIEIGAVDCDERNSLLNTPSKTLQSWIIDRLEELNELYIKSNAKLKEENERLSGNIEKMKSALIDIKSNTDDVNIEWQIKYLFDKWEIKENDRI